MGRLLGRDRHRDLVGGGVCRKRKHLCHKGPGDSAKSGKIKIKEMFLS
jgi:hypothetical protein